MGFKGALRSVSGIFSSKEKNKSNKPKKSQTPTNTTETKNTKVKKFVGFFSRSRSNRHSTDSDETLVGTATPSSTGNILVQTNVQVVEHAGSDDASVLASPSFADTGRSDQIIVRDFAFPLSPAERIVDNNTNNVTRQAVKDAQQSEHDVTPNDNNVDDTEGKEIQFCASYNKSADIGSSNTDHTTYHVTITLLTENLTSGTVGVTEPIGDNVTPSNSTSNAPAEHPQENEAPVQLSEINENNTVDPIAEDESSSSNKSNVAEVGGQSNTFPDHIEGYHFSQTTGPFAAATTVPCTSRSHPGTIITTPAAEYRPVIANEDVEAIFHQVHTISHSAPGRITPPVPPHSVVRERPGLSPSDADIESLLGRSENYLDPDVSDVSYHVLPHPDEIEVEDLPSDLPSALPSVLPDPVLPDPDPVLPDAILLDAILPASIAPVAAIPEPTPKQSSPIEPAPTEPAPTEPTPNEPTPTEEGEAGQETEVAKTLEEEETAEEILRTQVIPHRRVPMPVLPPGICIPWGPSHPVPIRMCDFRSADCFLPDQYCDPVGYKELNGIQRRWSTLETIHRYPIWYIDNFNIATFHHWMYPEHVIYLCDNFCGYFGCKTTTCYHPKPPPDYWLFPGVETLYPILQQIREEQMRRAQENPNQQTAAQHAAAQRLAVEQATHQKTLEAATLARLENLRRLFARIEAHAAIAAQNKAEDAAALREAIARTTAQESETVVYGAEPGPSQISHADAPGNPDQKTNFGLKQLNLVVERKESRFTKFFWSKEENCIEQDIQQDKTPDNADSQGQNDSSNDEKEDSTLTPETSLDGSQVVPQPVEAPHPEELYDGSAYEALDYYDASPPRPPRPAFSTVIGTSPVPIPDESVADSAVAFVPHPVEFYDDNGFLIEQYPEEPREGFGADENLTMGLVELPAESYGQGSTETFDKEGWVIIKIFPDISHFDDSNAVFDKDGWRKDELGEIPLVGQLKDAMEDGIDEAFEVLQDMSFYVNNTVDDDEHELDLRPSEPKPMYKFSFDSTDDETELQFPAAPSIEASKLQGLPESDGVVLGKRITIAAVPTASKLTDALINRDIKEACGIIPPHAGPEDDPDVRINRELSTILGKIDEAFISKIVMVAELEKQKVFHAWVQDGSQKVPNAPIREYLTEPLDPSSGIMLPVDLIERIQQAADRVWDSGISYFHAEAARQASEQEEAVGEETEQEQAASEDEEPASKENSQSRPGTGISRPLMTTLSKVKLGDKLWKSEKIKEIASKLNITHCVLKPWDNDPSAFDETKSTY
ncbi:hypothetical protein NHQ30_006479 [Ciborinia camelliae]|nr:hypothetical protein NHQ30_006479 [Ciborinia camelliae]